MREHFHKLARAFIRRIETSIEVDGLWVGADDPTILTKVEDALLLIKATDPRRYVRLLKDLRHVWVTVLPGALAQFAWVDWTCELDARFVKDASIERIASTIIHEATHARLWSRGVRYPEDIRHRVEAACFREEQAFGARLEKKEALGEDLQRYIDLPSAFWSDKAFYRRHVHGSVAAMRHLKVPHWLIGYILKRHRARRRRQRRAETGSARCRAPVPLQATETKTAAPNGTAV